MAVYETAPVAAEAQGLQNLRFTISDLRFETEIRSEKDRPANRKSYIVNPKLGVVLSRGFAPRTSAFAKRRAGLITP